MARDEFAELLDTAIYKEIASEALYTAGQSRTTDPGARALMKALAEEEAKHTQRLKDLKEKGPGRRGGHYKQLPDLRLSEYLTGGDTPEDTGLQDLFIFAIKREQQSVEFYSRMMGVMAGGPAKRLCQSLVRQELGHKLRLELLYDDLFYKED